MTRNFLTILVVFFLISCRSKNDSPCVNFHKGRFTSHEALGQRILINRSDSIQLETNEQTGHIFKSKIRWLNDCENELTDFMEKQNPTDSFRPWLPGKIVTTQLIKTAETYCVYESKMTDVSMKLTDTLWILKE